MLFERTELRRPQTAFASVPSLEERDKDNTKGKERKPLEDIFSNIFTFQMGPFLRSEFNTRETFPSLWNSFSSSVVII